MIGRWYERPGAWQALIGLTGVALYAHTVGFGWVYDDQMEIVLNTLLHSLDRLPEIFTSTVWAGSGMETYLYRPLALVTYALNHQISALEPWSYHCVNVALHALVSILVFRVGRLWGLPMVAAGLGGLLFAMHPAHVEVTAAVFGRKDLLATLFVLYMVLGHRSALSRGGWRLLLPGLAFAAALLSKEVGVVGLPLVVAHDWFLEPDRKNLLRSQRVPGLYVAYLAVLLGYLLVRNQVTGVMGVPETSFFDNPLVAAEPFLRLATALVVVGRGLLILLAPLTLSPDYSFNAIPLVGSAADPRFLGMVLLLLFVAGWLWWGRGRSRVVPLGVAWYALALLPTSNLLVTVGTIFGERTLYLPSVAFCLLAGLGLHRLAQRSPRPSLAAAGLLLALMGFQTLRYSRAWESDLSLFRWAVVEMPNSTKAHHKLGEEQLRAGELGDGVRSLGRALEIAPENEFAAITLGQARQLIGNRYLSPGGEAAAGAPDGLPDDPDILYVLAQLTLGQGSPEGAAAYWQRALGVDPNHAESSADLGAFHITQGDTLGGLELLEKAVRLRPSLARAWLNLGQIHLARGDSLAAREALSRFLSVAGPRFPNEVRWAEGALGNLGLR